MKRIVSPRAAYRRFQLGCPEILAVVFLAVQTVWASPPTYKVTIIDPPAGYDSLFPTGMGEGGPILGITGTDLYDPLAVPVVYSNGVLIELAKPTDSLNFIFGTVKYGLVVGSSSNLPYVWRPSGPNLLKPAGGYQGGFAYDVNSAGMIVGSVINDFIGTEYPAFWSHPNAEGVILEGLNGVPDGAAFAINEKGQIAGASGGFLGARWDDPGQTPLQIGPLPGGVFSEVLDLNELGDCAGRSSFADGTVEAMLYVDATSELIGLGFLEGSYSYANALNDHQQVVGNSSASGGVHAFLWDDGVLYDLNDMIAPSSDSFEYLANAVAIDQHGRIAAEAVVSTGGGMTASRIARLTRIAAP